MCKSFAVFLDLLINNFFINFFILFSQYSKMSKDSSGPKISDLVPSELKEKQSIAAFKNEIKKWKPNDCPCRLCKYYIARVGFI